METEEAKVLPAYMFYFLLTGIKTTYLAILCPKKERRRQRDESPACMRGVIRVEKTTILRRHHKSLHKVLSESQ